MRKKYEGVTIFTESKTRNGPTEEEEETLNGKGGGGEESVTVVDGEIVKGHFLGDE